MVVLLAREAGQVEDDDKLHLALVKTAVLQELLELSSIGRLRALAFLPKARKHIKALPLAVLFTRLELRRQTQVFCLLLRADANVDDSSDHRLELRPVRSRRQDARVAHGLMHRRAVLEEEFNQHARQHVRVLTNAINLFVRQIDCLVSQQLTTTSNRDLISRVRQSDLFHRYPHHARRAIT